MCIIRVTSIDCIQVIRSYILYTNYIVNFSIIKNSNNYKKCIVNNVQLLQNHYDYTSFTLITIIIHFMIELNNHNF